MAASILDQAHLVFLRANLSAAKRALAAANKVDNMARSRAMAQLNRARAYLREHMIAVEVAIYGSPRKHLVKLLAA
jgi:hypothetical protein